VRRPRSHGPPTIPTTCGSAIAAVRTRCFERDPALLSPLGVAATAFPGGHIEGYPDSFRALLTAVYADVAAGGPSPQPTYPTFADGHDAVAVCDAIAASGRSGEWTKVIR